MTAHTPGPWEIIQLPSMQYRIDAKVGPLHVCPAIANGLADARLIAAAPELLEALKTLYRAYVSLLETGRDRIISIGGDCDLVTVMEVGDPALRHVRSVVAKATGETT